MAHTDWPAKGKSDQQQPWQEDDPSVAPRAGLPVLASGSADPAAHELFNALDQLGYETPISRGENPVGVIGPEEMQAVRQFRADYGVQEDPSPWGGDNDEARRQASAFIGPWTAEAILRAAERQHNDDEQTTGQDADAGDGDDLRAQVQELAGRVDKLEAAAATGTPTTPDQTPAGDTPAGDTPTPTPATDQPAETGAAPGAPPAA
jgi:hypothetical protein